MKNFFIDVETTGLNSYTNGIIQLGGIIEIDGEEVKELNLKMKPMEGDKVEAKALEINGITKHELDSYPESRVVYLELQEILNKYIDRYDKTDKFNFIGYNSTFDERFIRDWFKKQGDNYYGSYFHWPSIDVAVLAAEHYKTVRGTFKNFKLMTVAHTASISIDEAEAHDAIYDIRITKKLYEVVTRKE